MHSKRAVPDSFVSPPGAGGNWISRYTEVVVHSRGTFFAQNLTDNLRDTVSAAGLLQGSVSCLVQHTTCALLLMEHEMGVLADIRQVLDSLVPPEMDFAHHLRAVDTNGRSHVLGALFNTTVTLPVFDGAIICGEYQDLVFVDFQSGTKQRIVGIHMQGMGS